MIDTAHKNVYVLNKNIEKIPRIDVIDHQTINPNDLFYQYSKHVPDFLFGKLRIRDYRDEPCFTEK